MDSVAYQKLLFRAAVGVMASDGEVHDDEIQELELACKNTGFFSDISCEEEFKAALDELDAEGNSFVGRLIVDLGSAEMAPAQELQLLEVVLRIIYADGRIDDNELKFLELLKKQLNIFKKLMEMKYSQKIYQIKL